MGGEGRVQKPNRHRSPEKEKQGRGGGLTPHETQRPKIIERGAACQTKKKGERTQEKEARKFGVTRRARLQKLGVFFVKGFYGVVGKGHTKADGARTIEHDITP